MDFRHGKAFFCPLVGKNTQELELVELPASKKFPGLFLYMFWDINLKVGINI